ncbi:hypothetical protein ACFLZX_01535 [Nanoarchaeota archaeon]
MSSDILERGLGFKVKRFFKKIGKCLFFMFRLNFISLLIIASLFVLLGYTLNQDSSPTGFVTMSDALAEKECPICEVCPECIQEPCIQEPCEPEEVIFFQCTNGLLVTDTDDCKVLPNITSEYWGYSDGFTLSIDGINYILEDDEAVENLYRIKWINFTLINEAEQDIVPVLEVRVYDEWSSKIANQYPQKIIETNEVLSKDEFIKSSVVSSIIFTGLPKIMRVALKDKGEDEILFAVTMPIE